MLLGLLLSLQFLVGAEILTDTVILGLVGVGAVFVYARWRHPEAIAERAPFARKALWATAITTVVLLLYPTWFALAGPAHLSGQIWPGGLGHNVSHLRAYVLGFSGGLSPLLGLDGPSVPREPVPRDRHC